MDNVPEIPMMSGNVEKDMQTITDYLYRLVDYLVKYQPAVTFDVTSLTVTRRNGAQTVLTMTPSPEVPTPTTSTTTPTETA